MNTMNSADVPLMVEPDELEGRLGAGGLLLIDLSRPEVYQQYHLPGAVHLDYSRIVGVRAPAMGLLPDAATLAQVLGALGITPDTHVIAYDDEGGGKACRLLWTLAVVGHRRYSLLSGGLHAWANEGHRLESGPVTPSPADCPVSLHAEPVADAAFILAHLGDPSVALLDARSPDEYHGIKKLAERAGHIPGAVNLDWTLAMDPQRNLRLRTPEELRELLESRGITPERQVVTYCQTHHRSAHTYIVLRSLGYPRVKGYPGSWSEWGNRADTPVEGG
jgi:thiosulfate/3-mercaptopyruvate sulfurtransferase